MSLEIRVGKLYDKNMNADEFVFYESGNYYRPLFILDKREAKCVYEDLENLLKEEQ